MFELPRIESKHPLAARSYDLFGNNTNAAQKANANVIQPVSDGRHMQAPPHVLPLGAMSSSTALEVDSVAYFADTMQNIWTDRQIERLLLRR